MILPAFEESETGGSQIISYVVSCDQGLAGAFVDLSGDDVNDLSTEQIYLSGVTSGVYYQFKYRARNVHGDGVDSDPFTILAATIPNKMLTPVIELTASLNYRISFV